MAPALAVAREPAAPTQDIYTNEEQVYFAKEAGRDAPPLIAATVGRNLGSSAANAYQGHFVDMFGQMANPQARGSGPLWIETVLNAVRENTGAARLSVVIDGQTIDLRRARPATCWVAITKDQPKADGSPDWFFAQNVKLHDQGGRALVGQDVADVQPLVIRMRNVAWPAKADGTPNTNKPSVVLYIHKPDKPDSAESYVWADPGAARIGINLRWMQASCGIDGMENPSAVTATSFRG